MTMYLVPDLNGKILTWGAIGGATSEQVLEAIPNSIIIQDPLLQKDLVYWNGTAVVEKSTKPSEAHVFDYTTKLWVDPRTLGDFKAAQWGLIKQSRSFAEYAGFTWDGAIFDSDAVSQNRITGAVTLAQMSTAFSIDWILANNTVRVLNQVDMLQVGAALGNHVADQFSKGVTYRTAIDAASTVAEVQAVVWE